MKNLYRRSLVVRGVTIPASSPFTDLEQTMMDQPSKAKRRCDLAHGAVDDAASVLAIGGYRRGHAAVFALNGIRPMRFAPRSGW